jgi:hypothetical protein
MPAAVRRIVAAIVLIPMAACRNPAAPEPDPTVCSLTLPSGQHLCFTPCPPGTKAWAANTPLPYSAANQCQ